MSSIASASSFSATQLFVLDLDSIFTPRPPQTISPNTNNSGAKEDDDDFIVETGSPHPDWKPGDLQPHPYLDLKDEEDDDDEGEEDEEGAKGEGGANGAADAATAAAEKKRQKRIRKALLAAPRHFVDPSKTPGSALYPLTISAVVPRPIALVSTLSPSVDPKTGKRPGNLAPFSYAGLCSHDPPHVAIGVCFTSGKPDRMKDTLFNILETKEFVVNSTNGWFVESLNHTCGFFDRGVDEMELAGLTPQASVKVAPPRVAEAAVQLECRLVASHPVFSRSAPAADLAAGGAAAADGEGEPPPPRQQQQQQQQTATVLIGEVVAMHVLEAVSSPTADGRSIVVDPRKLRPVCRLGGDTYGTLGRLFDLPRPGKEWQERRASTRAAAKE